MTSLDTLDAGLFSPLVGQAFAVALAEQAVPLELMEAQVLGGRRSDAKRDPFALRFKGAPGLRLPQGIYRLQHDFVGEMEIFITQNGDGPQGSEFEAIFT